MKKVLNLYAGIGGNRKLWKDVKVTAVEWDKKISKIYKDFFPDDEIIVGDAHQFLLDNYKEYDFIWTSPPCQTHSVTNNFLNAQGCVRYPNMDLYQEIVFLGHFCKSKWVVENVKSYYKPLITPNVIGRHYFWSNFNVMGYKGKFKPIGSMHTVKKCGRPYDKDKLSRNMVEPEIGLHILNCAFETKQKTLEGVL